ncbi:dihydrodipicolinate synthase family protein [Pedococcus sp. 2YAF34]|uniref:dihydrodipicolinate synthase family protein n=1 Tax=Pedococcus sp. 2YAF34 TaxID=3233032 RepID=UPI003F9B203B
MTEQGAAMGAGTEAGMDADAGRDAGVGATGADRDAGRGDHEAAEVREPDAPTLRGVVPIPVTTFGPDGSLDTDGLRSQVEFCLDHGADGILYPGVVSEFYTLTDQERRHAVETVVESAGDRVPVAVGVTGASTESAVEFARHAAGLEVAAVMTMVPYVQHFFGPSAQFVGEHTSRVADVGVPVIMQNARVGFPLGAQALAEVVAAVPGVRYVKEESNPPTHGISAVVKALGDAIEGVFGGIGGVYLVNELERGAIGTMPSPAFVDRVVGAYRTWAAQGPDAAQEDIDSMGSLFTREVLYNVAFHKEVLRRRGVIRHTTVRIASPSLDQVDHADLERMMRRAGL